MHIPLYQLDAFAGRLFEGNPAAVCPLDRWLPDELMQAIGAENNLSETAFLVRRPGAPGAPEADGEWDLRWFTPEVEVDLCGHATLASGWVALEHLAPGTDRARFHTKSGVLEVRRDGDRLAMDLPAQPAEPMDLEPGYVEALGGAPRETLRGPYTLVVYQREEEILSLAPNMERLQAVEPLATIVSAPGGTSGADFVSRFFAPAKGIAEDPVTGSAHCILTPYWAARLGRTELTARQLSRRGGELECALKGERVELRGRVVPYLEGRIVVPEGTRTNS